MTRGVVGGGLFIIWETSERGVELSSLEDDDGFDFDLEGLGGDFCAFLGDLGILC